MKIKALEEVKKEHIVKVLNHHHWNIKKAAFSLGITPRSIRNFIHNNPEVLIPEKKKEKKIKPVIIREIKQIIVNEQVEQLEEANYW